MAYIRTPFGSAGDRAAIPNDPQPDGSVSQTEGFPVDYQLDPATDPDAKNVPRDKFNEIMFDTQSALQQVQQDGFPNHFTAADNGGTAVAYRKNATVRATNGNNYYSLIDGNTDVPPSANWGLVIYSESFKTGDFLPWLFSTIRAGGWLWANGTTIGNAASGGTQRANADTQALFTMLWTDFSQAVLPMQDSSGAVVARGLDAGADYAANRRMPLPDLRGRGIFGLDNMGGAGTAGRITNALSGISGVTIGATGGSETVQLTANQNGQHSHTAATTSAGAHTHPVTVDSAGAHQHFTMANTVVDVDVQVNNTQSASSFNIHSAPNNYEYKIGGTGDISNTALTNSAGAHVHTASTTSAGAHTHPVTVDNSGSGADHQNIPPAFIAGGFIIKY